MKIINLSLDNSISDKNSALAKRVVEYGGLVEKYTVLAPNPKIEKIELSEKTAVYGCGGSNKISRFFKIYGLAKKLLLEEKYDIITVQDQYYLALIGLCLAKKFKIGLEIQIHGREKYHGLRKLIADYVTRRAGALRVVSQRLKRELADEHKIDERKITVAPIYSELRITNYELRIKKNAGKFIFLTVSRLVPVKNIALQIEAMREVVKKYPEVELWIIGDGGEKEKLKLKIACPALSRENWKLEVNVKLLGFQKDVSPYYGQADVFMLTSNYEGWGLSVIEAAGFGLPIIMTDVGCAGEVIKDGESGLIIPVGNKQKLVEAMLKIIEDENLRKKLGVNAKLAVGRLPSEEQTLALYKKSWEIAAANKL